MEIKLTIDEGILKLTDEDLEDPNYLEIIIDREKDSEEDLITVRIDDLLSALKGFEENRKRYYENEKRLKENEK